MNKLLRYFILFSIGLLMLIQLGCKEKYIPNKDMVNILAEVFITDAITSTSYLAQKLSRKDSIEYYEPIVDKYGYTEGEFIYTINYLMDNPSEFEKLMDKVVGQLSIIETEKAQLISRKLDKKEIKEEQEDQEDNLWANKRNWKLPEDGSDERLFFKVPTQGEGLYSVTAKVIVKPEDQSVEPSMHVWFYTEAEPPDFRFTPKQEKYLKDGEERTVILRCMLTDTTMTHFMGYILDHQPRSGKWTKYAEISKISIKFTPLPDENIKPSLSTSKGNLNDLKKIKPKGKDKIKKSTSRELYNAPVDIESR